MQIKVRALPKGEKAKYLAQYNMSCSTISINEYQTKKISLREYAYEY